MISPSDFIVASPRAIWCDSTPSSNPRRGPQPAGRGSEPIDEVGRSHGHQRAVFMAVSGQFRGRLWAVFHGRRHSGRLVMGRRAGGRRYPTRDRSSSSRSVSPAKISARNDQLMAAARVGSRVPDARTVIPAARRGCPFRPPVILCSSARGRAGCSRRGVPPGRTKAIPLRNAPNSSNRTRVWCRSISTGTTRARPPGAASRRKFTARIAQCSGKHATIRPRPRFDEVQSRKPSGYQDVDVLDGDGLECSAGPCDPGSTALVS